jgi:hypothetical protein
MTPKETAKNLVNKFYIIIPLDKMDIDYDLAKKFALIAVDEIIKAVNDPDDTFLSKDGVDYWCNVKQEIEKL